MVKFKVALFDGESYGERFCPFDLPENQIADDLQDAIQKSMFAWEDGGVSCEATGSGFVTSSGEEYGVFIEEIEEEIEE